MYEKKTEAEAKIALADATFYARKQAAEAELYAKKKEAEGIVTLGNGQGVYVSTLLNKLGGDYAALRDYLNQRLVFGLNGADNSGEKTEAIRELAPSV
jgi:flotillin